MKKCSLNSASVKLSIDFHYSLFMWCEKAELRRQQVGAATPNICFLHYKPSWRAYLEPQVSVNAPLLGKASTVVSLHIQYRLSRRYYNIIQAANSVKN